MNQQKSTLPLSGWFFVLLAFIVFGASFLFIYLPEKKTFTDMGPLGDWMGGMTAPFLNIAGFIMIYAAFRQQGKHTLDTQHAFQLQRFESTFFQLIHLYHQNVSTIQTNYLQKSREDFFEAGHRFLSRSISHTNDFEDIRQKYKEHYESNANLIDHYVRHIRFMLQYLDRSTVLEYAAHAEKREAYLDILTAQLSNDELFLLFYHCLCEDADYLKDFRPLLKKYHFFERLQQPGMLLSPSHWLVFAEVG